MSYPKIDASEYSSLLERVYTQIQIMVEDGNPVDIVTFIESKEYLGQTLYPRQRLLLKIYYKLDLSSYPCWCLRESKENIGNPDCNLCAGSGLYDELSDVKHLLSCKNKYAKLHFPLLCRHHVLGECTNEKCHLVKYSHDYRILPDDELRQRLQNHHAHIFLGIAGRRGSKSALGAFINAYEQYMLNRDANPQLTWGLLPGQAIGTGNVAADEQQALILFKQFKAILDNSPWFQKIRYRALETVVEFPGRSLYARSMHSNSSSVRGQTLKAIFLDEFCHFNRTGGKLSDKAMWAALAPSVITFKGLARIVVFSSPLNKAGQAYELFELAEKGEALHVIAVQLATWEMNPTVTQDNPEIVSARMLSPEYAEMEYGAQWAESAGQFIPEEAIVACVDKNGRGANTFGLPDVKYQLHLDLSKRRDRTGLVVTHWDRERRKVVVDLVVEFDPQKGPDFGHNGDVVNELGEIDVEKLFEYVRNLHTLHKFHFNSITCDQFNSVWLVQALRKHFGDVKGDWVGELHITDKLNREAFGNLRSIIVQGGLDLYRHHELISQLTLLAQIIKDSGAWKVEAPPGYHDDLADSLAFAVLRCLQLSLGITSGIVLIDMPKEEKPEAPIPEENVYDERKRIVPQELFEAGVRHSQDCRPDSCVYNCPVLQAHMRAHRHSPAGP